MTTIQSTTPITPLVKKRREKGKGKALDTPRQSLNSTPKLGETSIAGSKLPPLPSATFATPKQNKLKKKKNHAIRTRVKLEPEAGPTWDWNCIPIAQSEISRIPPVWSRDGRFYFVVSNDSVHIHSSTSPTFTRLSTLSSTHPQGHKKPITSITVSPTNPLQLITSSEDGTAKIWDWVEGRLIRTITLTQTGQVSNLCVGLFHGKWHIFAGVTVHKSQKSEATYRVVCAPMSPPPEKPNTTLLIGKLSGPVTALIISPRCTYLVALSLNKAYTYRLSPAPHPDHPKPTCVKFVTDQRLTCGAFAPEKSLGGADSQEEWFATGDATGVIRLWHGLGDAFRQLDAIKASGAVDNTDKDNRLPTTSLHWHAHAVAAIAFTPSGAQLLSVGEESVLVQWHLASGKREYIPRISGRPIVSLAVRQGGRGAEEEWWMGLSDGSVVRVGAASGAISNVGQGIRLDPFRRTTSNSPYPLVLHPTTNALVVPSSHPSTIQFIDPLASTVLFDLEVAPSNRISRRDEKELEPVSVERVDFSPSQDGTARWMATMEGRKGDEVEGGGMVKNLKIWRWNGDKYIVNTQFPRPHSTSEISTITFSPIPTLPSSTTSTQHPYLLTTSRDGTAKIWTVRQAKNTEHGKSSAKKPAAAELFWAVRSSFHYRSKPIYSACFSPDCTLVALAHGSVVTLWDVESNVLLRVLDAGAVEDLRRIGFVGSSGRHLAGVGACKGVALWDLLSCQVEYSSPSHKADFLLTNPTTSSFITSHTPIDSTKPTIISIFSTTSTPRSITLSTRIKEICHLPSPPNKLHLAGISPTGEIYRFGDIHTSSDHRSSKSLSADIASKSKTSIWQEMFGKDAFIEDLDVTLNKDLGPTSGATGSALQQRIIGKSGKPVDVFEGASHTLPPVSLLFDAFMDELLSGHTAPQAEVKEEPVANGIQYDVDEKVEVIPILTVREEGRKVDQAEISELEAFFKQVLGESEKKVAATPQTNGHSKPTVNGTTSTPKTLANGHVTPHKKEPATPVTPKKSLLILEQDDEEAEGKTPADGSEKKRGKKRRAPRDA